MTSQPFFLPFKSSAAALVFTILLGPIGLLYSSFWGGLFMTSITAIVLSLNLVTPAVLTWVISVIWGVGAVEIYNRNLLNARTVQS